MDRFQLGMLVALPMLAAGLACDDPCPSGQRSARTDDGEHVCLGNDEPNPGATASDEPARDAGPEPYPMPPPASASLPPPSQPPSEPPPVCETLAASGAPDVPVVVKAGASPTATELAPPDGKYVLVQASAYPTDPGGSPLSKVRASLSVAKTKIVIGAQATKSGSIEANESFTFTLAPSAILKQCETKSGSVSTLWFPGAEGVKRTAKIEWDATTGYFTLVVRTPFGDVELVFAKS